MVTLSDIQIELLSKLKSEGYEELKNKIPGFEYKDDRYKPGQRITVTISNKKGVITVRSEAIDIPLSSEEQEEMERLFGKDDFAKTESIEWHDGFDIDRMGNITNLHPDDCDD
jgi:hypothetical protein